MLFSLCRKIVLGTEFVLAVFDRILVLDPELYLRPKDLMSNNPSSGQKVLFSPLQENEQNGLLKWGKNLILEPLPVVCLILGIEPLPWDPWCRS